MVLLVLEGDRFAVPPSRAARDESPRSRPIGSDNAVAAVQDQGCLSSCITTTKSSVNGPILLR
jgi:hypothetical protein